MLGINGRTKSETIAIDQGFTLKFSFYTPEHCITTKFKLLKLINILIRFMWTLSVYIIIKMLREHHIIYTFISDYINKKKYIYTVFLLH